MSQLPLKELRPLIIEWATEKNIHLFECAPKQYLKLVEECGELASAILKGNVELQKDAIGDIFVVLVIYSKQLSFEYDDDLNIHKKIKGHTREIDFHLPGIINSLFWINVNKESKGYELCLAGLNEISEILNLDLTECANIAWNEIKNRTGRTENGTFIKD
jgi:hypothetical protein